MEAVEVVQARWILSSREGVRKAVLIPVAKVDYERRCLYLQHLLLLVRRHCWSDASSAAALLPAKMTCRLRYCCHSHRVC